MGGGLAVAPPPWRPGPRRPLAGDASGRRPARHGGRCGPGRNRAGPRARRGRALRSMRRARAGSRDGAADQLVPERDAFGRHREQSALLGRASPATPSATACRRGAVRRARVRQRVAPAVHGPGVESAQPGEHRVETVGGTPRWPPAARTSATKKGLPESPRTPAPGRAGWPTERVSADLERRASGSRCTRSRGTPGEEVSQRVLAAQLVVPVGEDEYGGQPLHPPDQKAQGRQRGLVGPVDVLHHEYRGCGTPATRLAGLRRRGCVAALHDAWASRRRRCR